MINKKSVKRWVISALVIMFFAAGSYATAKINTTFSDPLEMIISNLTSDLDLTSEQSIQVENIKASVRERWEAEISTKSNNADKIMNAFSGIDTDWSMLRDYAKEHPAKVLEMKQFAKDKLSELKSFLTPEQKTKLENKISALRSKSHVHKSGEHENEDHHSEDHHGDDGHRRGGRNK